MLIIYLIVAAAIVICDQLVKAWIVANLSLGESMSLIKDVFSLTYFQNTGAAWSILEGKMSFFAVVTVAAVAVCSFLLIKNLKGSKFFTFGMTLIIAGAIGNFIDRMRMGYVVDMFQTDFINFPIFNVADMSLVIGVALVFIYVILDERTKE